MTDKTKDTQPDDTVPVEDLDKFVVLLTNWHSSKIAMLKHMMAIPEGTEAELETGEKVKLTGDMLRGFRMGLTVAISEVGKLPFVAEMEEQAEAVVH